MYVYGYYCVCNRNTTFRISIVAEYHLSWPNIYRSRTWPKICRVFNTFFPSWPKCIVAEMSVAEMYRGRNVVGTALAYLPTYYEDSTIIVVF